MFTKINLLKTSLTVQNSKITLKAIVIIKNMQVLSNVNTKIT